MRWSAQTTARTKTTYLRSRWIAQDQNTATRLTRPPVLRALKSTNCCCGRAGVWRCFSLEGGENQPMFIMLAVQSLRTQITTNVMIVFETIRGQNKQSYPYAILQCRQTATTTRQFYCLAYQVLDCQCLLACHPQPALRS